MKIGIALASHVQCDAVVRHLLTTCDYLIAADGGARHLKRLGLTPDVLLGDFDSIDEATARFYQEMDVERIVVPRRKNETDAELAVTRARAYGAKHGVPLPDLCVVGALGGRLDHEWGTLLHLAAYVRQGGFVEITDGVAYAFFLAGDKKNAHHVVWPPVTFTSDEPLYASSVALSDDVRGLSYDGLIYPLSHFDLAFGSTRGVSNEPKNRHQADFSVSLQTGLLMVSVTP